MKALTAFFIFFSVLSGVQAQIYVNPEVKDGFFPTRNSLYENNPILPEQIVSQYTVNSPEFYKELANQPYLYFKNQEEIDSVRTDTIFALSTAGVPHIQIQGGFYRCVIFGTLCYVPTVMPLNDVDPVRNNRMQPSFGFGFYGGFVSVPVGRNNATLGETDFIFRLDDGVAQVLDRKTLLPFIESDEQLYQEFTQLKRKQQKEQKYIFIRYFNENHPLPYFE